VEGLVIKEYKERLFRLSTELNYKAKQSEEAAKKVKEVRDRLSPETLERMRALSVDVDYYKNIDLDRMQKDKAYYEQVMSKLKSEYSSLVEMIEKGVSRIESSL